jgi:hypothetical protein
MAQLSEQYNEAEEFLSELTNSLVGGDRQRVVVVPGNHDVSLWHTVQSLRPLPINPANPLNKQLVEKCTRDLSNPHSTTRWSWKALSFYDIENDDIYRARLDAFGTFYSRFYGTTRSYSLAPAEQFDVFHYPEQSIAISAFNSCYNNDPLNRRGMIYPDCIAKARTRLKNRLAPGTLLLAVWHHNTPGGPTSNDFMDADTLQVLIDCGYSIGIHGHQHKPQYIDERYEFGGGHKITVISAASLCAGPTELPSGHARGYNIIQIDPIALKGKVHQRRMVNENFGSPIWGPGVFPSTQKSFIDFSIQPPGPTSQPAINNQLLARAEDFVRHRRFTDGASLLLPLAGHSLLARRLLLECYIGLDATADIVTNFNTPQTSLEAIHLIDALWAEKNIVLLQSALNTELVRAATDPALIALRDKYTKRLKI